MFLTLMRRRQDARLLLGQAIYPIFERIIGRNALPMLARPSFLQFETCPQPTSARSVLTKQWVGGIRTHRTLIILSCRRQRDPRVIPIRLQVEDGLKADALRSKRRRNQCTKHCLSVIIPMWCGCPARTRTSINGIRNRCLTIRRRGNGRRAINRRPWPSQAGEIPFRPRTLQAAHVVATIGVKYPPDLPGGRT